MSDYRKMLEVLFSQGVDKRALDNIASYVESLERKADAYSKMIPVLKLYHYDGKEHGGHVDYQSPATMLLRELGELE